MSEQPNYVVDFDSVTRITAGAVGQPGRRVFYLQARRGNRLVSLRAEKEQVRELAAAIVRLLEEVVEQNPLLGSNDDTMVVADMSLEEPIEPEFRIAQMGLAYDPERDQVVLIAQGFGDDQEVLAARFTASREQMGRLSDHAQRVVAAGRPLCGNCGRPIDVTGHFCPQRNGHGPVLGVREQQP